MKTIIHSHIILFMALILSLGPAGCFSYEFDFSTWDAEDVRDATETGDLDVQQDEVEADLSDAQPDDGLAEPDGEDAENVEIDALDGMDIDDVGDAEIEGEGECGNSVTEPPEECDGDESESCITECDTVGLRECIDCLWVCTALPDDNCNGTDEDCDTTPDDGYVPYQCGLSVCIADSYCEEGHEYCEPGYPTGDDTDCNGIDEDCEGGPDDKYEPYTCGQGVCQRDSTCVEGDESCVPGTTTGTDDDCDGLDDNCNGLDDENYLPTFSCGFGYCEADSYCEEAEEKCDQGDPRSPTDPTCDGVDDDCDTVEDDEYVPYTCGQSLCERNSTCIGGDEDCTPGESGDEICWNEIDENCDTVPDDGCTTCDTPVLCSGAVDALAGNPTGGRFTGVTGGGSTYQGSCGGGGAPEAVYYFTVEGPDDVDAFITTHGASFDTVVYVRDCECDTGEELACNDDADGLTTSTIQLHDLHPGTYMVFVDGKTGGDMGGFSLDLYVTPTGLDGDRCGNPVLLPPGGYEYISPNTTCNLSRDYMPAKVGECGLYMVVGDAEDMVFYFWVPADGTTVTFNTCNTLVYEIMETDVYVRKACNNNSAANSPGCDATDPCGETFDTIFANLTVTLDRGLYYFFLDGYDDSRPTVFGCGQFWVVVSGL
ncbi:MAG: hypothetical protein ABIJ56_06005 [Pseudomonadota bacterium]